MHPIERLRMVARATGDDPGLIARQAAASLLSLADDPGALLTASRRLIDRHPTCGPLWWLAARMLAATDPLEEAVQAADELDDDPTPDALAAHLPDEGLVGVLGWPDQAADALTRRLDVTALVVDAAGEGSALVSHLIRRGGAAVLVSDSKVAGAVLRSDLVVLEATALGPGGLYATSGSRAAAAVGRDAGHAVWAVAGIGRVLPQAFWDAIGDRLSDPEVGRSSEGERTHRAGLDTRRGRFTAEAWSGHDELVPLRLIDQVVGPDGPQPPADALARADAPSVPELTRRPDFPPSPPAGEPEL